MLFAQSPANILDDVEDPAYVWEVIWLTNQIIAYLGKLDDPIEDQTFTPAEKRRLDEQIIHLFTVTTPRLEAKGGAFNYVSGMVKTLQKFHDPFYNNLEIVNAAYRSHPIPQSLMAEWKVYEKVNPLYQKYHQLGFDQPRNLEILLTEIQVIAKKHTVTRNKSSRKYTATLETSLGQTKRNDACRNDTQLTLSFQYPIRGYAGKLR